MKKLIILPILFLAACGGNDKVWKDYQCKGKNAPASVKARFFDGGAEIDVAGREKQTLKQAVSASGAKYAVKGAEFWTKGDWARLTLGKASYECALKK